ncbi:hypothetical protein [Succinimonas sp.]|uniref:hypothetical protein n=1 Tax=Succinimonas sp. TaxID=1936151 RepID=UPI00386EEB8D
MDNLNEIKDSGKTPGSAAISQQEDILKQLEDMERNLPKSIKTRKACFRYLMNGEILKQFSSMVANRFLRKDAGAATERLTFGFRMIRGKAVIKFDAVCVVGSTLVGVVMDDSDASAEEYYSCYWALLCNHREEIARELGIPEISVCIPVIFTQNSGMEDPERWAWMFQMFPHEGLSGRIIGEANPRGLNALIIDFVKFRKLVKKQRKEIFLERFIARLLTILSKFPDNSPDAAENIADKEEEVSA